MSQTSRRMLCVDDRDECTAPLLAAIMQQMLGDADGWIVESAGARQDITTDNATPLAIQAAEAAGLPSLREHRPLPINYETVGRYGFVIATKGEIFSKISPRTSPTCETHLLAAGRNGVQGPRAQTEEAYQELVRELKHEATQLIARLELARLAS